MGPKCITVPWFPGPAGTSPPSPPFELPDLQGGLATASWADGQCWTQDFSGPAPGHLVIWMLLSLLCQSTDSLRSPWASSGTAMLRFCVTQLREGLRGSAPPHREPPHPITFQSPTYEHKALAGHLGRNHSHLGMSVCLFVCLSKLFVGVIFRKHPGGLTITLEIHLNRCLVWPRPPLCSTNLLLIIPHYGMQGFLSCFLLHD